MAGTETEDVARQPKEPLPEQLLEEMNVCEPYTASDLADAFEEASRWTIQRRLDDLVDEGKVQKKKHSSTRVSYWVSNP